MSDDNNGNTGVGGEGDISYNSLPFKMALPMVAVGTFILALSFAFCCYLARLRKHRSRIKGYKKVILNKKKENPLEDTKNETCPVCLEDFKKKEVLAICPCHHVFHKKCLCKWLELRPTCPMCMSHISVHYHSHASTGGGAGTSFTIPATMGAPAGLFPSQV
uniref:RING finger protein 24 n=1 Tax=Ciona intestinalis TaxID=7719 RepID=H2XRL3_CIOIN|nr:RING finger protein 24 [Ciona intestinalis]|eukprot:XP_002129362.1 RING finger protein 24 [Ciona intestinalis]